MKKSILILTAIILISGNAFAADITNPQAVKFANEKARRIADLIVSLDRTLTQFQLDVVRDFENITVGNVDADKIIDGAALDGRNQVTKVNVAQLKYVVEKLKECLDLEDRRANVNKWNVNGDPIF